MSTIIFLIFSFFEKKEGKVSILAASLLPVTLWYFYGRCSTLHCLFYLIITITEPTHNREFNKQVQKFRNVFVKALLWC